MISALKDQTRPEDGENFYEFEIKIEDEVVDKNIKEEFSDTEYLEEYVYITTDQTEEMLEEEMIDEEDKIEIDKPKKSSKYCEICNKYLKSCRLRAHIDAVHKKITRFVCDKCGKRFYYK